MADFEVTGEASLDPEHLIGDIDEVLGKFDEFEAKLDEISAKLDELADKGIHVEVVIDGQEKLDELLVFLDEMDTKDYVVTIKINIDGQDKLDELKLKLDEMERVPHDITATVKVDGLTDAETKMAAFNKTADDTAKKLNDDKKSADGFSFSMMMLAPLAIPAAAGLLSLIGAAGGLAASFGAVAIPALAFGYSLKSMYTQASTLVGSLTAAQQAALANDTTFGQVTATLDKSSKAYQNMNSEMRNIVTEYVLMKNAITTFQNAIQPQVAVAMYNIMLLLKVVLTDLTPAVQAFGTAFDGVLGYLLTKLQDPTFQKFFSDATRAIGTLVTNWGDGVVNIIEGIAAILDAFLPFGVSMSGGFLQMTKDFDNWAQHLGNSPGFKKFISTVETDGPLILKILGQIVLFVWNLVSAIGESKVNKSIFSDLLNILTTINKFLGTHQGLSQIAGDLTLIGIAAWKLGPALGPIIAFIASPIGLAVVAVLALGAAFFYAYTHSKQFHDWVVQNLKPLWDSLTKDVSGFSTSMTSLWPTIKQIWARYLPQITQIVTSEFTNIIGEISGILTMIEGIIQIFAGIFSGKWGLIFQGVENLSLGFGTFMKGFFLGLVGVVGGLIEMLGKVVWGLIGKYVSQWIADIVTFIVQTTSRFAAFVTNFISQVNGWWISANLAVLHGITNALNFIGQLPGNILRVLGNMGSLLWNAGIQLIQGFINGIENMFGSVQNTLSTLTSLLTSWKGPPERDRTLLYNSGQMIIDGFVNGLESRYSKVASSLGGLTNTIGNKFGSQFSTDISAKLNASLNSQLGSTSLGQGGNLGSGGSVTIASGAISIYNPTPEPASQSLTKMLQSTAAFGIVQAPMGAAFPGGG